MTTSLFSHRSAWLLPAQVVSLALALLLGAGCSVVSVHRPIGEKPHALVAADWEGWWVVDKNLSRVKVTNPATGELRLVSLEDADSRPRLVSYTAYITESGNALFASMRTEGEDTAAKSYVWARLRHDRDQVHLWWPDPIRFAELVRSGKLPGKLDGGNVQLDSPTAEQLAAIVSGALGPVFDAESPGVLRRVAR